MHKNLTLKARLFALLAACFVPVALALSYYVNDKIQTHLAEARHELALLARSIAARPRDVLPDPASYFSALYSYAARHSWGGREDCDRALGLQVQLFPAFINIALADTNGVVWCAANKTTPAQIKRGVHFRRAMQSRDLAVGDYYFSAARGEYAIGLAYAIADQSGAVTAVVSTLLNAEWLDKVLQAQSLPESAVATIVDTKGRIIARSPRDPERIGNRIADAATYQLLSRSGREVVTDVKGVVGHDRLVAYAPILSTGTGNLYARVSLPKALVYKTAWREGKKDAEILLVLLLCAVTVALVVASWLIFNPVRVLTAAAKRLADGDLSARTNIHAGGELGALGWTLDHMAEGLQKRQAELSRIHRALRTVSASNRCLLRSNDESKLLNDMCSIAVHEGGYRAAWVAFVVDGELLEPAAHCGLGSAFSMFRQIRPGDDCFGAAIRSAKTEVCASIEHDPTMHPWRNVAKQHGIRSIAVMPLMLDGLVGGVITICAAEVDYFTSDELHLLEDLSGDLSFGIAAFRERHRREKADVALKHALLHDDATGLPNRSYLSMLLNDAEKARQPHDTLTLLFIHITNLSDLIHALGHRYSEDALRVVVTRLQSRLPHGGVCARVGDDMFALMIPQLAKSECALFVPSLQTRLSGPLDIEGVSINLRICIGIAMMPDDGLEGERLMLRASIAARRALDENLSYARVIPESEDQYRAKLRLISELKRAIEGDLLTLYYQPKVRASDGAICSVEGLVRWLHPERGVIMPGEFIEFAEETGLIKDLFFYVVRMAVRQIENWLKAGIHLPVALNVSAVNLSDPLFETRLNEVLHAVDDAIVEHVHLELTETCLMTNQRAIKDILARLRKRGIRISIDDFGRGYSSLSYLSSLPVHALKIDSLFVRNMTNNERDHVIVASVISLAKSLNLEVIAEGVETKEQAEVLVRMGCDQLQGFLFSAPVPARELQVLMQVEQPINVPWAT
jgi:diguanylate cyclase (GGDEF)-like protein